MQIMVPWSMTSNQNGNRNQVSYVITIEESSYTLHLKQQVFLPNNFRVYTYSQEGSVNSDFPHIKRDCFYKGYIAGFPNSVVTLSTCSGLRGILQLKNVSYGIEPLDSTPGFQHLVYQIWNENIESLLFVENDSVIWSEGMTRKLDTGIKSKQSFIRYSRYLEMHVILDKDLECLWDQCCQRTCKFRRDIKCITGDCCWKCRFVRNGTLCRSTSEDECDLIEYCNGSSAHCTPDFWVMDGHPCNRNTAYCFKGVCQTADKQCKKLFGKASKSGSLACYEEINSQKDRMGHCGSNQDGYQTCKWKDLQCGKLVCQYPSRRPFIKEKAAVIYARVQNSLCITLDYMKGPRVKDPMLVKDGTVCGKQKICMNQKCGDAAVLKYNCDVKKKCNDHGVCNNRGNCHCRSGWLPPDCKISSKGYGGSIDSTFRSDAIIDRLHWNTLKNWLLLSFCLFLPVLVCSIIMIIKRNELNRCCTKEESQVDELEDMDQSENASV
ncbi:disintegrin and metalloproteinase domain-containing protein 32-like isoform X1 [Dermochelys coriacea]|uniref:disintegrin and metalloproteinase domain-containing protein 32-like isoform X1 n=2 Tax=Dermochelys coriacea TaxID=27794 RepID=UPI001CA883A5|nr:disintegrin and metalloproteinase domain-containing protein 32-like isoform X1 [Dermochelys coriacea]